MVLSDATVSECQKYRYVLERQWNKELPYVLFVGLNPSIADGRRNDPTTNKLKTIVQSWGDNGESYGGIIMVNLYAYIDTRQNRIWNLSCIEDMIGRENDDYIESIANRSDIGIVILGWGDNAVNKQGNYVIDDQYYKRVKFVYLFL